MSQRNQFFASFRHAGRGIGVAATGRNFRVMIAIAAVVVAAAIAYDVSGRDWAVLLVCIAAVLGAEAANTAVELLADIVEAEWHPVIRDVKDLAAGAVLIMSIIAAVAGALVLWPYVSG
jgi:diacylglycerol kinase